MLNNKWNLFNFTMTNWQYQFDAVTRFCDLSNGAQDSPLWHFFLSRLNRFDFIFSGRGWISQLHDLMKDFVSLAVVAIVWIDKLHDLMKEFASLTMAVMEIGRKQFLSYNNGCYEEKIFNQKHESYRY